MRMLLLAGLVGIVLSASCGELPSAPTKADPVIIDDGGRHLHGEGNFSGGG